ncbi:arylamine N-acetyltransferase family protein [Kribbella sp. CA-293567]|uniref:arylamine N-acetyltransferase family protein n=1 Tax=Kribbella sp. CA-293567 TaxID=3002436 RepID=UPI0022DE15E7|nr:arylamine N-acetyltransferase [Kribbella sp. CA-293567]WBQ06300.1 arylamine N-acetyltransferase [Kribbella sp. CA-293567]
MDTAALLRRIGVASHPEPSVEALFALHAAFVDQVPYETVQYQFGRGGSMDPEQVAQRIIARETGGYCFQLNGVFAQLLTTLGYAVTLHRGGVQTAKRPPVVDASHLVLTVVLDEETWLVDVGLGDGLLTPMPLRTGVRVRQEPFDLSLRRSDIVDGWRLDHDPRSSLTGMDFEAAPAAFTDFEAQHQHLSLSPESPFVRTCSAFVRRAGSTAIIRSVGFTQIFADRIDNQLVESQPEYYELLADVFRLPLPHLTGSERDELWRRVWTQYENFLTRQAAARAD